MKIKKNPTARPINQGKVFKNLKMIAEGNTIGQKHISIQESVLVIQKGSLIMHYTDEEIKLLPGDVIVIPEGVEHYLEILEDTEAVHIMPIDNKIKFLRE